MKKLGLVCFVLLTICSLYSNVAFAEVEKSIPIIPENYPCTNIHPGEISRIMSDIGSISTQVCLEEKRNEKIFPAVVSVTRAQTWSLQFDGKKFIPSRQPDNIKEEINFGYGNMLNIIIILMAATCMINMHEKECSILNLFIFVSSFYLLNLALGLAHGGFMENIIIDIIILFLLISTVISGFYTLDNAHTFVKIAIPVLICGTTLMCTTFVNSEYVFADHANAMLIVIILALFVGLLYRQAAIVIRKKFMGQAKQTDNITDLINTNSSQVFRGLAN